MIDKKSERILIAITTVITTLLLVMILWVNGFIPWGSNKSLASMDAHIQYIDLFAYLKYVLAGKNSFSYTFSNMLGGGAFAIFSYYLSSPINLLVLFFNKENLRAFFDIAVVIKLSLASLDRKSVV